MDLEPAADPDGRKGMKIVNILPGSTAERAGLQVGDIITRPTATSPRNADNSNWIITNAAPDNILKLIVRKASDGQEQTVRIDDAVIEWSARRRPRPCATPAAGASRRRPG